MKLITNLFKKPVGKKLYSVIVTEAMLQCLEDNKPSGGWYKEYCMNSQLFKARKCPQDGRKYKKGQMCPCFVR